MEEVRTNRAVEEPETGADEQGMLPTEQEEESQEGGQSRGLTQHIMANHRALEEDKGEVVDTQAILNEVISRTVKRETNRYGYINLVLFVIYLTLYVTILMLQRDVETAYGVEQAIKNALFDEASGTADSHGTISEELTSLDEFWGWMETKVIDGIFDDPVCGDGICDAPMEFAQWESHGCEADCGIYPFSAMTRVVVQLEADFKDEESMQDASWNLCSSTHEICLFTEAATPVFLSLNQTVEHEVYLPDGNWSLSIVTAGAELRGKVVRPKYDYEEGRIVKELETLLQFERCLDSDDESAEYTALQAMCQNATCGDGDECRFCLRSDSCVDNECVFETVSNECTAPATLRHVIELQTQFNALHFSDSGNLIGEALETDFDTALTFSSDKVETALQGAAAGASFEVDSSFHVTRTFNVALLGFAPGHDQVLTAASEELLCGASLGVACNVSRVRLEPVAGRVEMQVDYQFNATHFAWATPYNVSASLLPHLAAKAAALSGGAVSVALDRPLNVTTSVQALHLVSVESGLFDEVSFLADLEVQVASYGHLPTVRLSGWLAVYRASYLREASLDFTFGPGLQAGPLPIPLDGAAPPAPGRRELSLSKAEIESSCEPSQVGSGCMECLAPWICDRDLPNCYYSETYGSCVGDGQSEDEIVSELERNLCRLTSPLCYDALRGNGACDPECNTFHCGYDNAECADTAKLLDTQCAANCFCDMLDDGVCNPECRNQGCAWDMGDCCEAVYEVPLATFDFKVNKLGISEDDIQRLTPDSTLALNRYLTGTNRVLNGVMLTQRRYQQSDCPTSEESRFTDLCDECVDLLRRSTDAYGVDPVFLPASPLYDASIRMSDYYDEDDATVVDEESGLPYGFHFMEGALDDGSFPLFFDINMSKQRALTVKQYGVDGQYLDANTKELSFDLLTYNCDLDLFAMIRISFDFSTSGRITMEYEVKTLQADPYKAASSRVVLELLFLLMTMWYLLKEVYEMFDTYRRHGSVFHYWVQDFWNYLDLLVTFLSLILCYQWLEIGEFNPWERSEVYLDLAAEANMLSLDIEALNSLGDLYSSADTIAQAVSSYLVMNGLALVLMVFRLLQHLHFQDRIGLVTRTISKASGDLLHFLLLFMMVFCGYSLLSYILFGSSVESFSTFGKAMNSCFDILMGDIEQTKELRLVPKNGFVVSLFFYSYVFLVFFILFNILLAILVDAYVEIKGVAKQSHSIPQEVAEVVADMVPRRVKQTLWQQPAADLISDRELIGHMDRINGRNDEEAAAILAHIAKPRGQRSIEEALIRKYNQNFVFLVNDTEMSRLELEQLVFKQMRQVEPQGEAEAQRVLAACIAGNVIQRFGVKSQTNYIIDDEAVKSPAMKSLHELGNDVDLMAGTPVIGRSKSKFRVVSGTKVLPETPAKAVAKD